MKTQIYAPRLYGDIDLGLEPSRIDTKGNRDWARMIFPGMRIPGMPDQLITAQSEDANFEIGTRKIEYGRTFRYSQCGSVTLTTADSGRLVKNGNYEPESAGIYEDRDGFYGDLLNAAPAGTTYLDLEEDTADRDENAFQGGYVLTWADIAGVRNFTMFYIVWSDASESTYTRIYLDHPIVTPISATNGIQAYYSPYSNIIDAETVAGTSYSSFVGRVLCGDVTANYYFWLQTAGPCLCSAFEWGSANTPGYAGNSREIYAWTDGSVASAAKCPPATGFQRVGYLLPSVTASVGTCFFMLQLE